MAAIAQGLRVTWRIQPAFEVGAKEVRQIARQFPFAAARALNDVALHFQRVQRAWQEHVFEIRRHDFFFRAVKKDPPGRVDVNDLQVAVIIDPRPKTVREATSREDIFIRQQEGGTRLPQGSHTALAIPQDDVQRGARGLIRASDYPNNLRRKFVIEFASGTAGLFQRIGRRQKAFQGVSGSPGLAHDPNVRFLYFLAPEADIDPALNFFFNAELVFLTTWEPAFKRRLKEAFASLKVG